MFILNFSNAIQYLGPYDAGHLVKGETYFAKIDNFYLPVAVNGFSFQILPAVSFENETRIIAPSHTGLSSGASVYEGYIERLDYSLSEKITFNDRDVRLDFDLTAKKTGKVGLKWTFSSTESFQIFTPEIINKTSKYVILFKENGEALGIVFSTPIKIKTGFETKYSTYDLFISSNLSEGEKFSISIFFVPLYIKSNETAQFSWYSTNTFFKPPKLSFSPNYSNQALLVNMMEFLQAYPRSQGEFTSFHDASSPLDSLSASVYFKKLCYLSGLSCRLVFNKAEKMYAWVEYYKEDRWIGLDPYEGKVLPPKYSKSFEEPFLSPMVYNGSALDLYLKTSFLENYGAPSPLYLIFLALSLLFISFGFLVLILKSKTLLEFLKRPAILLKEEFDGTYECLREPEDVILKEIYLFIKQHPEIKVKDLCLNLRYSKEFVCCALKTLMDEGYVRKVK
ncbi:MAG: hypothetical protein QW832_01935 [archaeon]